MAYICVSLAQKGEKINIKQILLILIVILIDACPDILYAHLLGSLAAIALIR